MSLLRVDRTTHSIVGEPHLILPAPVIRDDVKALVPGKNFATISTLIPSGQIQTHVVWVDCDDEHIVINTEVELRKFKNVQADPRATLTVWDKMNPSVFAELRGRVVEAVTGSDARAHIDSLAGSTSALTTRMS